MIAAQQPTIPLSGGFLDEQTFDFVVFGSGDGQKRYSFTEFRELPLRHRVHLLLSSPPRFYVADQEVPRSQAMRFRS
jgi:hypothetical protein